MNSRIFLFFFVALISCTSQKRITESKQIVSAAIKKAETERKSLAEIKQKVSHKLNVAEVDDSIKNGFIEALAQLNAQLDSIEQKINAINALAKDKSNFRGKKYEENVAGKVETLNSFNVNTDEREHIYNLVNESISIKAYNLFNLAAFFEPGIYKISETANVKFNQFFLPAIDSMSWLSNKYKDIPRTARMVFVGYADASPIIEGSPLYNDLARFSAVSPAPRQELNRILSDLRAKEMLNNMKSLMTQNGNKFDGRDQLQFDFLGYGRGEALPVKTIKDYKEGDERRRIVMLYWAVLPNLNSLKKLSPDK